jgi:hypothetical protein
MACACVLLVLLLLLHDETLTQTYMRLCLAFLQIDELSAVVLQFLETTKLNFVQLLDR